MKKLKEWIKENIVESIGILGGTIAVIIVVIFVCFFGGEKKDETKTTSEKSAAGNITTSEQIEKTTTYKDSNTNTSLEKPEETTEEESTTLEKESTTLNDAMGNKGNVEQSTTLSQMQTVNNQTTQANKQPQTTNSQTTKPAQTTQPQTTKPTATATVRGKDGIILEKLKLYVYIPKKYPEPFVIDVPENTDELIAQTGDDEGEGNGDGYGIFDDSYTVRHYRADIFNNDICIGKTKSEYIKQIYGEPYYEQYWEEYGLYRYVYRYGYGKDSLKDDIYINMQFSDVNGIVCLSGIIIINGVDTFL